MLKVACSKTGGNVVIQRSVRWNHLENLYGCHLHFRSTFRFQVGTWAKGGKKCCDEWHKNLRRWGVLVNVLTSLLAFRAKHDGQYVKTNNLWPSNPWLNITCWHLVSILSAWDARTFSPLRPTPAHFIAKISWKSSQVSCTSLIAHDWGETHNVIIQWRGK